MVCFVYKSDHSMPSFHLQLLHSIPKMPTNYYHLPTPENIQFIPYTQFCADFGYSLAKLFNGLYLSLHGICSCGGQLRSAYAASAISVFIYIYIYYFHFCSAPRKCAALSHSTTAIKHINTKHFIVWPAGNNHSLRLLSFSLFTHFYFI